MLTPEERATQQLKLARTRHERNPRADTAKLEAAEHNYERVVGGAKRGPVIDAGHREGGGWR